MAWAPGGERYAVIHRHDAITPWTPGTFTALVQKAA
jgi:hypothetical protein